MVVPSTCTSQVPVLPVASVLVALNVTATKMGEVTSVVVIVALAPATASRLAEVVASPVASSVPSALTRLWTPFTLRSGTATRFTSLVRNVPPLVAW